MAKQRVVYTSFRSDPYIEDLTAEEKLLFLYFITNDIVELCGIYEISKKKIIFETGVEKNKLDKIIDKFTKDGKIVYINGYVCVKNFQKHQKTGSLSIDQGIERSLSKIPQEIKDLIQGGYTLPPPSPQGGTLNLTLPNSIKPNLTDQHQDFKKFIQEKIGEENITAIVLESLLTLGFKPSKEETIETFRKWLEENSELYQIGRDITKRKIRMKEFNTYWQPKIKGDENRKSKLLNNFKSFKY